MKAGESTHGDVRHYRFGGFVLDVRARELRRTGGAPVALTAKAFDVLCVLVQERDRMVGRDELFARVWPGRVVEENTLTQAVSALRHALGTKERYVVTVPGRGYRFVADVVEGDAPAIAAQPDARAMPPAPLPRPRRRLVGIAVIAALVLVAVAAWRLRELAERPRPSTPSPASDAAILTSAPATLAVLPFRTLPAGASRDELLELGLADTLITRIGSSTALRVTPLSSSQRFAGTLRDPVEAARELGVAYVVDGTSQRQGNTVKVNVRLLAADGTAAWSGTFDEDIGRIFTLQDRVADDLAAALAVKATAPARHSPCDGADAEAYRAYLSGQYRLARPSAASARQAIADFRRAIDLDPTCARAYAFMAYAYRARVMTAETDPNEDFPLAKAMVDKALALDPQLAEAYMARGWIQFWYDWDWAASEASFRRAIELNPSLAEAHFGYAHLLGNIGRPAEADEQGRQAFALDPLSPVINAIGGGGVARAGPPGHNLDRALELDPDYWLALLMRGRLRVRTGDAARGLADLERARQLCGDCSHALTSLGLVKAQGGDADAARAILRRLQDRDRAGYVPASDLAKLHYALGERDAALDLLERAYRERDVRMVFLKVDADRRWSGLRAEPRFRALLRGMDFPEGDGSGVRTSTPVSPTSSAADRSSR